MNVNIYVWLLNSTILNSKGIKKKAISGNVFLLVSKLEEKEMMVQIRHPNYFQQWLIFFLFQREIYQLS